MGSAFLEDPGVDEFMGFDLTALQVDEAYVKVVSEDARPLTLYSLSHDCYHCPLQPLVEVPPGGSANTSLRTRHPWTLVLSEAVQDYLPPDSVGACEVRGARLGEFGVYQLSLSSNGSCLWGALKEPVFEYGAIVVVSAVYALAAILAVAGIALFVRLKRRLASYDVDQVCAVELSASNTTVPDPVKPPPKPRVKSLDTFRGISIVVMIFVNYGAGGYWFLEHATWNGLQVADLVFPWFMWIMGVCIPMGLRSALRRDTGRGTILWTIIKRSVKLFMLGIILNSLGGWVWLDKYRIPGVLQRFAITYLVTAGVALALSPRQPPKYQSDVGILMGDVIQLLPQWAVHLLILAAHTLITFLLPVPDCPTGYLGPGGVALLQNGTSSPQCIGGAAGEVDRWLLTSAHIYQNPTAKHVYSSGAFDPEGVLGSLTSTFQVFLGLQAGVTLLTHTEHRGRLVRWLTWAALTGVIGTILCSASMNGGVIPVNKNLWSLSYVMVTSCFALLLLSICYLLVDVWGVWSGAPFMQAGMNSIFLYCGHMLTYNLFPWHYAAGLMNTHVALLFECLWGTTLWVIAGLYLHHKGKFYTV